ncbi:MAG: hypothetical protein Q6373_001300 [Candidatus Sigynarchaeota archaeon]
MPNPIPNIIFVLFTSNERQLVTPASRGYNGSACLAGASWATNFVSLLSSSVPSHHRVWGSDGKVGIHVDPLPVPLKKAGYRAAFIGPHEASKLAAQCGFDDPIIVQDGDGYGEATAIIERHHGNPVFLTCIAREKPSRWQGFAPQLAARKGSPGIVLLTSIVPPSMPGNALITKPDDLSSPFIFYPNEGGKRVNGFAHLWSIIDIAPSLLGLLGVKAPYTMVGKDMHQLWLGKTRKSIRFPRNRCLFDHADGSKTMWNGRYLLSVHPGTETGEIFDLYQDNGTARNLWDDPSAVSVKSRLLLELLWAQLDKECTPMPRIAGA